MKNRILIILSIFIIGVSATAMVNYFFLPSIYEAKTQILVNQKSTEKELFTFSQTEIQLIETYNEIIKSPAILDLVIKELNLDQTTEELSSQISVTNNENSKVVHITVQDQSAKQSVVLANKIATIFKNEIPSLMNVDNINILSNAKYSENMEPVRPKKLLNTMIAAVVSFMMGIGIVFLVEYFDSKVKNERELENILKVPNIGYISPMKSTRKRVKKRRGSGGTRKKKQPNSKAT